MGTKGSNSGHEPVLAEQVVRYLATEPNGAYLDLTVGPGGHLKALSQAVAREARLYGLDRDASAIELAKKNLQRCPQLRAIVCSSYSGIDSVVEDFDDRMFDGILLDLGISSLQLDDPARGFSFRFDGPLDMRFDAESGGETAADLINSLSEIRLAEIISEFGEEKGAGRIARAIVRERQRNMVLTTAQLKDIVLSVVKKPHQTKSLARVFQAFRIAVNRELGHLTDVLPKTVAHLKPGGRLAVISYHSLEDRAIKHFFQQQAKGCICPDNFDICVCGVKPSLKILTRKAVTATEQEEKRNPRSRSARLRVAEKIAA
ncbi:MAG: 16S rRNA (cytosine(1402)-N(4))-methyltransferase RsmH [Candidatus Zixiibacteriota bacterium]